MQTSAEPEMEKKANRVVESVCLVSEGNIHTSVNIQTPNHEHFQRPCGHVVSSLHLSYDSQGQW